MIGAIIMGISAGDNLDDLNLKKISSKAILTKVLLKKIIFRLKAPALKFSLLYPGLVVRMDKTGAADSFLVKGANGGQCPPFSPFPPE